VNGEAKYPPESGSGRLSALNLVRELRRMGVKSAALECGSEGDVWSIRQVEFFPATEPIDTSPSLPKSLDLGGPEMCACSHDETQHSGGFCLLGCRDEMCNPPKGTGANEAAIS
jgi:hypothetical protein